MGSDLQASDHSRSELDRLHAIISQLTEDYPLVENYVSARSNAGAGGSGGGRITPVNLEVLSFINGNYWVGVDEHGDPKPPDEHGVVPPPCASWWRGRTGPRCWNCGGCADARSMALCRRPNCGADPDNWRAGIKPTVFGLEASVRSALGFGQLQRRRPAGYGGHGPDPRVDDALGWLNKVSHTLVDDHPQMARTVRQELARVASRAKGMIHGSGVFIDTEHSVCQHCGLMSVFSDIVTRAVCTNVDCRKPDGSRHCWERDPATDSWHEVEEPDGRRGRGRNFSDEQAEELRREADEIKRAAGRG